MSQDKIESRRAFMKKFGKQAGVTIAFAIFVLLFSTDALAANSADSFNSFYGLNASHKNFQSLRVEKQSTFNKNEDNKINSENSIRQNRSLNRLVNGSTVQLYAQANVQQQQLLFLLNQRNVLMNSLRKVESAIQRLQRDIQIEEARPHPSEFILSGLYRNLSEWEQRRIQYQFRIQEIEAQIQQLGGGRY